MARSRWKRLFSWSEMEYSEQEQGQNLITGGSVRLRIWWMYVYRVVRHNKRNEDRKKKDIVLSCYPSGKTGANETTVKTPPNKRKQSRADQWRPERRKSVVGKKKKVWIGRVDDIEIPNKMSLFLMSRMRTLLWCSWSALDRSHACWCCVLPQPQSGGRHIFQPCPQQLAVMC